MTNILSDILNNYMSMNKMTLQELANQTDISEDTLKAIRYGKSRNPSIHVLCKLADTFHCSVDSLIGHDYLSDEDNLLFEKWQHLGHHGKAAVNMMIESQYQLEHQPDLKKKLTTCLIPFGYMADGAIIHGATYEFIHISDCNYPEMDYAIKINGNALTPLYFNGDLIAVERRFPKVDEIAIFLHDNKEYIRRYTYDGRNIRLEPVVPACKAFSLRHLKSFTCIGTVMGVIRGSCDFDTI